MRTVILIPGCLSCGKIGNHAVNHQGYRYTSALEDESVVLISRINISQAFRPIVHIDVIHSDHIGSIRLCWISSK